MPVPSTTPAAFPRQRVEEGHPQAGGRVPERHPVVDLRQERVEGAERGFERDGTVLDPERVGELSRLAEEGGRIRAVREEHPEDPFGSQGVGQPGRHRAVDPAREADHDPSAIGGPAWARRN